MRTYESVEDYYLQEDGCDEHKWPCVRLTIGTKEYHFTNQQAKAIGASLYLMGREKE